jgi:hypothetical protein
MKKIRFLAVKLCRLPPTTISKKKFNFWLSNCNVCHPPASINQFKFLPLRLCRLPPHSWYKGYKNENQT